MGKINWREAHWLVNCLHLEVMYHSVSDSLDRRNHWPQHDGKCKWEMKGDAQNICWEITISASLRWLIALGYPKSSSEEANGKHILFNALKWNHCPEINWNAKYIYILKKKYPYCPFPVIRLLAGLIDTLSLSVSVCKMEGIPTKSLWGWKTMQQKYYIFNLKSSHYYDCILLILTK